MSDEYQLMHGDCLERMKEIPDGSVDMVMTDPPYFKVKGDAWDRQWDKPACFLEWLGRVADEWYRVLVPNGSLYCFASPQMSARVEVMLGGRFNVLNNIRWIKEAGWHQKAKKETLRRFLNPWESCIFCEHLGADNMAKGEAGYQRKCDELRGFVFEPLRAYMVSELGRSGMTKKELNEKMGFAPHGMADSRYFGGSQWQLPTAEYYEMMRDITGRFSREYEDLRREYEDLRRPFAVTKDVPYTDVWTFEPVKTYKGKHPCEKPQDMLRHIITASTREGATILDSFMGTGSAGIAATSLGRKFIGIELGAGYMKIAERRIQEAYNTLF